MGLFHPFTIAFPQNPKTPHGEGVALSIQVLSICRIFMRGISVKLVSKRKDHP